MSDQTPSAEQPEAPDAHSVAPPDAPPETVGSGDADFVGPTAPEALPLSTTATRGRQFKELLGSPLTIALTGVLAIGVAVISIAAGASAGIAVLAAAVAILIALAVVFAMAGGRARNDFYTAYADGRGLTRSNGRTTLPPVTDLLRKGDNRYAEEAFSGELPGGLEGELAMYTYEEETRDSDGNKETTYVHFTVALTNLPETAPLISELAMQRRSGFRFMDGAEDVFRKRQRVELESVDADKHYEIFIGENDSMNVARQIFSPTFIVWMVDNAPEEAAFELSAGALCVNVKGHKDEADELDQFCVAASAIAKRLHEEASE